MRTQEKPTDVDMLPHHKSICVHLFLAVNTAEVRNKQRCNEVDERLTSGCFDHRHRNVLKQKLSIQELVTFIRSMWRLEWYVTTPVNSINVCPPIAML